MKEHILADCRELSGGTMANLTGINKYDYVEFIQCRFVEYVANDTDECFETWLDAWKSFRESGAYFNVLRELDTQIKTKENAMTEQTVAEAAEVEAVNPDVSKNLNAGIVNQIYDIRLTNMYDFTGHKNTFNNRWIMHSWAQWTKTSERIFINWKQSWEAYCEAGFCEFQGFYERGVTRDLHPCKVAQGVIPDNAPESVKSFFQQLDLKAVTRAVQFSGLWDKFIRENPEAEVREIGIYLHNNLAIQPVPFRLAPKQSIYDTINTVVSKDQTRDAISGFLVTEDSKQLVATDGCRLLILPYGGKLKAGIWKEIKDKKYLDALCAYTYDEYLQIWQTAHSQNPPPNDDKFWGNDPNFRWILSSTEPMEYDDGKYFLKVNAIYPSYMKVMPDEFNGLKGNMIECYSQLRSALHLYKIMKTDYVSVGLKLGDKYVTMHGAYLRDGIEALATIGGDIELSYNSDAPKAPVMLRAGDAVYVLMPRIDEKLDGVYSDIPSCIVLNELPETPVVFPAGYAGVKPSANKKNNGNPGGGKAAQNVTRPIKTAPTAPAKAAIAARKPVPVNDDGSISPTERVLKNLVFKQLMRFGKDVHIDARKDVIHKLFDAGKLAISEYMDKKGKKHYLVAKQFMGDIAHKYASYLLGGGQKFDFSPVEGR